MAKDWNDMTTTERLEKFDAMVATEMGRGDVPLSSRKNAIALSVRYCVHPSGVALGKEFMRRAAVAVGDSLDADGVWPECYGEVWVEDVLGFEAVAAAGPVDLALAEQAYEAFALRARARGSLSRPSLPAFAQASPSERARWLAVVTSPLAALKGCSLAEVAQGTCKP